MRKIAKNIIKNEDGTMEVTIEFNPFTQDHFLGKQKKHYAVESYRPMVEDKKVQMQIQNGYAIGFYGHGNRNEDKGYIPNEKNTNGEEVFPCCKTLSMEWVEPNLVRHTQRILNNEIGLEIQKLIESGVGGFSSVHDLVGRQFYGFDYVVTPNLSSNRIFVDNVCKNGVCNVNFDSVEFKQNNEIKSNIKEYLQGLGKYSFENEQALYKLETKTSDYVENKIMMDSIKIAKEDMSNQVKEVEIKANSRIKDISDEFSDFVTNKHTKILIQLDSLGYEVDEDYNIIATEKSLTNLFKPIDFDEVYIKNREQVKNLNINLNKNLKSKVPNGIF